MANECPAIRSTATTAAVVSARTVEGVAEKGPNGTWKEDDKGRESPSYKKQAQERPKEVQVNSEIVATGVVKAKVSGKPTEE